MRSVSDDSSTPLALARCGGSADLPCTDDVVSSRRAGPLFSLRSVPGAWYDASVCRRAGASSAATRPGHLRQRSPGRAATQPGPRETTPTPARKRVDMDIDSLTPRGTLCNLGL